VRQFTQYFTICDVLHDIDLRILLGVLCQLRFCARRFTDRTPLNAESYKYRHVLVRPFNMRHRPVARGGACGCALHPIHILLHPLGICKISKTNMLILPVMDVRHAASSTCSVWLVCNFILTFLSMCGTDVKSDSTSCGRSPSTGAVTI
jgi:hypothetical protein